MEGSDHGVSMRLHINRFARSTDASMGALSIDGRFSCFTLEDEARAVKVKNETRIPAGLYQIRLRIEGGMHEKYSSKFDDHVGMLWLQNVPGFEWIYIHPGNDDDDTSGCILVGDGATASFELVQSVQAYRRLYRTVSAALISGEPVEILIEDEAA